MRFLALLLGFHDLTLEEKLKLQCRIMNFDLEFDHKETNLIINKALYDQQLLPFRPV